MLPVGMCVACIGRDRAQSLPPDISCMYLSGKMVSLIASIARSSGYVGTRRDIVYISLVSIGRKGYTRTREGTVFVPTRVPL